MKNVHAKKTMTDMQKKQQVSANVDEASLLGQC